MSTLSKLRGGKPGSRTKQITNYKAQAVSSVWLWSGKPFPPPGDFPNPGMELRSPSLQAASLPAEPQGGPFDSGWTIELFSISGISISALIKISLTCTVHQWSLRLPSSCLVIETNRCMWRWSGVNRGWWTSKMAPALFQCYVSPWMAPSRTQGYRPCLKRHPYLCPLPSSPYLIHDFIS